MRLSELPQIPEAIAQSARDIVNLNRTPTNRQLVDHITSLMDHLRAPELSQGDLIQEAVINHLGRKFHVGVGLRSTGKAPEGSHRVFSEVGGMCFELNQRGGRIRPFQPDYENDKLGPPVALPREIKRTVMRAIAFGEVIKIG